MQAKIIKSKTDKNIPYIELRISDQEDDFDVTFRAYYKNVFVAVEDNRDNPFSGADLDDCFIVPAVIIQKTLKTEFKPFDAFLAAMAYGGYIRPSNTEDEAISYEFEMQAIKSDYAEIEKKVKKWMRECGIWQPELDSELDDHWYSDNPNY